MRIMRQTSDAEQHRVLLDPRTWTRPWLALVMALLGVLGVTFGVWFVEYPRRTGRLSCNLFSTAHRSLAPTSKNNLPTLHLDIGFTACRALEKQGRRALPERDLTPEDERWVRAHVRFQGHIAPVLVQVKRDQPGDFDNQKWPLYVKVQNENSVGSVQAMLDMHLLSLQSPATSGYLDAWLYAEDLRRTGIPAPRHTFVNLIVNDRDWGTYALQEGISETFARHQESAWQALDSELKGKYLAHSALWGIDSGLGWQSQWDDSDPLTPWPSDSSSNAMSHIPADGSDPDSVQYHSLAVMEAYVREIVRVARPRYIERFRRAYAEAFERHYLALAQEFASMELETPWSRLPRRQEHLRASLHLTQTVSAYQIGGELGGVLTLQVCNLARYPVILDKVQVGEYEVDITAAWIPKDDNEYSTNVLIHPEAAPAVVLRRVQGGVPRYLTLRIPASALANRALEGNAAYSETLQLVTHLAGVGEPVVVAVQREHLPSLSDSTLPLQPTVEEALAQHPFLRLAADQPRFLELKPGDWDVQGDLVLPDGFGLWATHPLTLAFDDGAMLFANGPLMLYGTEAGQICLVPKEDSWAGIVVFQADPEMASSLRNVEIRAAAGVHRDGLMVPGGVTFYESPAALDHCLLQNSVASVALHIVHADFELVHTAFRGAALGAFRGDFARGTIGQCTYADIRGDGIQVHGSQVAIRDVHLSRIYGRGISARETSSVAATDIQLMDVYLGLVSSDGSLLVAQDLRIARAWAAGLAAYRMNSVYGRAVTRASDVTFEDQSIQAMAQKGSCVIVNEKVILAKELDVGALHHQQEILSAMHALDLSFGSELKLIGYEVVTSEPRPGSTLSLNLYWYALAHLARDYTVFVHVRDPSGSTVVGWDNMPGMNTLPTTGWRVGRLVVDVHLVPLPPDMPEGEYHIALGMYDLPTGERLPVRQADGEPFPEATVILEQTIKVGF